MPPTDLGQYVAWIIEQKPEMRETPADVKRELQDQLEERLEQVINMALLANMPKGEFENFEKLLDNGSQEEIEKFVADKIPNMNEIIAKVLVDFREQYLGSSGE